MQHQYALSKNVICVLVAILAVMNVFPPLMGNSVVSITVTVLMFLAFIAINAWNGMFVRNKIRLIALRFVMVIIYSALSNYFGKEYPQAIRAEIICFCALIIGISIYRKLQNSLTDILRVYCLAMFISCIGYIIYWSTTGAYGYALKNNYSPMILFSVLILFHMKDDLFKQKLITYGILLFQLFVIFSTNCRSVAFSTCFLLMCFLLKHISQLIKWRVNRNYFFGVILFAIIVFVFKDQLWKIIYDGLRLSILEESGTEKYSANRLPMIANGLRLWSENPLTMLFGASSGGYIECFYIDTLTYRGIIGLGLFLSYFASVLRNLFFSYSKTCKENKNLAGLGISVFIAALLIGVFEAGAPLIQGSTYFIMWFLAGVTIECADFYTIKEGWQDVGKSKAEDFKNYKEYICE